MLDTVARDGLVLLGCGKMGTALLTGWLAAGGTTDVKYAGYIAAALAATDEEARFAAFYSLFFDSKDSPRPKMATAPLQKKRPEKQAGHKQKKVERVMVARIMLQCRSLTLQDAAK